MISHARILMIISHVKIIGFQTIINLSRCLEIPDYHEHDVSHSTLEINLVFPRTLVLSNSCTLHTDVTSSNIYKPIAIIVIEYALLSSVKKISLQNGGF